MKVTHDNLADMGRVLNNIIYQKGGWALHMLRNLVGTDTFWTAIRNTTAQYRDAQRVHRRLQRVFDGNVGAAARLVLRSMAAACRIADDCRVVAV